MKYMPIALHCRPYNGYDAKIGPTILNFIRDKYVDVSELLLPNKIYRKIRII
jgi:hypothetical protein